MQIVALQPSHLLDIDLQAAQASGFAGRLAMTTQQAADIVAASGVSAAAGRRMRGHRRSAWRARARLGDVLRAGACAIQNHPPRGIGGIGRCALAAY